MDGRTDGWMDGRMDVRTENLPILPDFVPYRGRCPEQGKGTADHLMPLGYLLELMPYSLSSFGEFGEEIESQNGSDVFEVVLLCAIEEVIVVRFDVHRERDFFIVIGGLRSLTIFGRLPDLAWAV